ncbi:glycerophosphoryl diester phosphodiesterase membrane domain-containing protein [Flammeovirga kamogawensis]|uniref:Glycerophosphoryl diester phosphodiesterase membrane domain-containing protein n=1 Tax=Flammeovirga kamogawensis TaxID=373891 RepID=A0ABX8H309_9BACT|nr:glycerophosphoryl diester phosphodiesterase membrane domain-containing protein [Flammeovirga kamogawensis]MBB6460500.1 hypothetical protein [Flammeovirga kamogawensis]QWG10306.1 glycerophosphoryl diester phosphodiesterase membrane domain-containing protein [Flammeovirga kamogawensis]TRX64754.1 hypothetical protein EO216_19645 [Flammeovirga kamogawensis]
MQTEQFDFNKERGLGEKIEFTFSFWKENFKVILISILTLVTPFGIVGGGMTTYVTASMTKGVLTNPMDSDPFAMVANPLFIIGNILIIFSFIMLTSVGTAIIKVYLENEELTATKIRESAISNLRKIFGISVASYFLIFIGSMAFLIPGIYLAIGFSLAVPLVVFENASISEALSKSRKLVSGNWWSTLGYLIVISFIASFFGSIISFVGGLFSGVNAESLLSSNGEFSSTYSFVLLTINFISNLVTPVFYVIVYFGIVVQYFSLKEQKEATSILNDVEAMS